MKKILIFILFIISIQSFAQNPPNYTFINGFYRWRGGMHDSALHIPRYNGAPSGLRVGSSTMAGAVAMDTTNHLVKYYSGSIWRDVQPIRDGLYSGGIVTWDSLLVFTISAAVYYIGGVRYETAISHITLDAANGSNPRIDLIVATTSGIGKITGTAAASPAEPNLPIDNIRLTAIYVNTSATTPTGPITKIIYDENTEFTGAATSVTADFDNFTDPYHFVKATSTGAITSASFITYTGTDFSIAPYNIFKCFIKLKSAFAAGTRFVITWYKDGVQVSTSLTINNNTYGYIRTSGSYQEITIPVADFSISGDIVDQVKIALSGSNSNGFYIDYIQLKGGVAQATAGTRFGVSGEDGVATQARYFNAKNLHQFNLDSIPSFVLAAAQTRFRNLAQASWLQYLPLTTGINIDPLSTSIPVTIANIPYNSGAALVHLALDTLTNRLYRKTAGGTPTLDQVLTAGSSLTNTYTIDLNSNALLIEDGTVRFKEYMTWDGNSGQVLGKLTSFTNINNYGAIELYNSANGNSMQLQVGSTASNRTQLFQDASGVIALKGTLSKGVFVASPTATDTVDVWQTPVAITITSLKTILRGSSSPSVTFNIGFGTSIQSPTAVFTADITCTSITTGCSNSSGFNDATIPAGSFIWIYTTAQSGTVRSIAFTINYTED